MPAWGRIIDEARGAKSLGVAAEQDVDERGRVVFQALTDAAKSLLVIPPDGESDPREPDGEAYGENDERPDDEMAHVQLHVRLDNRI